MFPFNYISEGYRLNTLNSELNLCIKMVWATKTEKVRAYNNKKEGLKFAKVNAHQYVKTSAAMTM